MTETPPRRLDDAPSEEGPPRAPGTDELERTDPVEQVLELLREDDTAAAVTLIADLRPPEAAEVLERLSDEELGGVIAGLDPDVISGAIEYVAAGTLTEILRYLEPDALTETIAAVPDDLATDMVQGLDQRTAAQVLDALPEERREELEQLLVYGNETAGGRMTGQVITLDPTITALQAIDQLRQAHADATKPFYLYVTDADRTLRGVVNVRSLITAPPESAIADLMTTDVITVEVSTDQEEAARILQRHNLMALPVVDRYGALLGTLTSDDLFDVIEEETTEDIYRLALVHEDEDLRGVLSSVRHRLPWLSVNLVTAMTAAWVVSFFEDTLTRVAILAAFLPVIGGQGGNAGIQTLTIIVRSLALERITPRETPRLITREAAVGLMLGVMMGLMVGVVAWVWQGNPWLGGVVFAGLAVNILVGTIVGVLIPMALQHFKQDPALSGGIWLTAATDLSGFFAFLGTATLLISHLE